MKNSSLETRVSLSAQDWAEAALDAMAAGGLEAVAVEPLARRLGVTKGSFYWHFPTREALIQAALAAWEKREIEDVIAHADQHAGDPRERIHSLFREVANTDPRSERLLLVLSATDHLAARECVQRINERRRTYVCDCYRALGLPEDEAHNWATFAHCIFMGTVRMRRDNPDALPAGPQFNEYLRFLIRTLIPPASPSAAVVRSAARLPRAAGNR
ncbi:MAG: TetR/AcrR family transcriptional regulator [Gammaproteobacteria bacterium]|nr:TetR/AcrR family transcriptional regulator [Gammaproteobacteria bacterium]